MLGKSSAGELDFLLQEEAHGGERTTFHLVCISLLVAVGCTRLVSTSPGILVHFLLCAKPKDSCCCILCMDSGDLNPGSHAYSKSFIH